MAEPKRLADLVAEHDVILSAVRPIEGQEDLLGHCQLIDGGFI